MMQKKACHKTYGVLCLLKNNSMFNIFFICYKLAQFNVAKVKETPRKCM